MGQIPHTFSNHIACKFWFNATYFNAIQNSEITHRRYRSHPSPKTHTLYICLKSMLKLAKDSVSDRKCKLLISPTSFVIFYMQPKNLQQFFFLSFPLLFRIDDTTAVSCIIKAELFTQSFANFQHCMIDSLFIPHHYLLMILCLILDVIWQWSPGQPITESPCLVTSQMDDLLEETRLGGCQAITRRTFVLLTSFSYVN